ncbi:MAG: stage II sporulation protein D [Clostridia bacterium]|nr:stage II sporulation protein D [Clostridia bacterium]
MKDFFLRLAFLIVMLVVVPCVINLFFNESYSDNIYQLKIYESKTGKIIKLDIEDYISGVVAAEMPATFGEEALKSQAVAARTYALRKINKDAPEHKGADLCTDFAHCQAYYDEKQMREKWGSKSDFYINKINDSVLSTKGEYLSYNNEIASTVFHACSNGITENSQDVWGGSFPYLICVDSPGDMQNPNYITHLSVPKADFVNKLNEFIGEQKIESETLIINEPKLTEGGNVKSINVSGIEFEGTQLRKVFGLKSSAFTLKYDDETLIFDVYGSGHGVGMSQYGAQAMAIDGADYKTILSHYYPGTNLKKMYK